MDARWVFLNDGGLRGGILRPMHAWHLERGQEVLRIHWNRCAFHIQPSLRTIMFIVLVFLDPSTSALLFIETQKTESVVGDIHYK